MRFLPENADGDATLPLHLAGVGLIDAGHDSEECRFAGAVRADKADAVAERNRSIDVVEDDERADLADHARQPDDRHFRTAWRRARQRDGWRPRGGTAPYAAGALPPPLRPASGPMRPCPLSPRSATPRAEAPPI